MSKAYVIHLERATERLPLIEDLKKGSGLPIQIFPASNGSATWNDTTISKRHPLKSSTITQGMVGCSESHIAILEQEGSSTEPFFLFEDDAEFLSPFQDFIDGAPHDWDILLLGANEYVKSAGYAKGYRTITKFWGSHAMLIHPRCSKQICKVYYEVLSRGIFLSADWIYNEAIHVYGLRVYGSTDAKGFFKQKSGVVSLLTGIIR